MDVNAYARQLKSLLPTGAAWNTEPGSNLSNLLLGLATELARIDGRSADLLNELDPRTTSEMIAEWERVLSLPDPCVPSGQTSAQRVAAIVARVVAIGGQSPAYYIAVALALGFVVTITEFSEFSVNSSVDDFIYGPDWAYTWQVNAPLNTVGEFVVDSGTVDDPLAWWGNTGLECVLSKLKPSHTKVIFTYS